MWLQDDCARTRSIEEVREERHVHVGDDVDVEVAGDPFAQGVDEGRRDVDHVVLAGIAAERIEQCDGRASAAGADLHHGGR